MPYPMAKKITKEDVAMFFEMDINNCLLKKEDFCGIVASFINDPISTSKLYKDEINLYFETRRDL